MALGRSFKTTNTIENLNSQLPKYLGRVKHWINTEQRHRWVALSLLEIETRMRRICNYKDGLSLLRAAMREQITTQ